MPDKTCETCWHQRSFRCHKKPGWPFVRHNGGWHAACDEWAARPEPPGAWKHETCETCEYRVDKLCRAGPAARLVAGPEVANGPVTYEPACAQWRRASDDEEAKILAESMLTDQGKFRGIGLLNEQEKEKSNEQAS